jgi:hypothetical protein
VPLNLIDYASVGVDKVKIKFGRTVKISSITNDKFVVQTSAATPALVSNPFKAINSLADYNTISRTLTLYWDKVLVSGQEYYIRAVGLLDSANEVVAEEYIKFTKQDAATPSGFSTSVIPEIEEILVEDNSILTEAYSSYQIIAKNPEFYIDSVDPASGSFYIANDNNDGRVTITFNARPASNFLSNRYFKAQRKKIQKSPSRWENVETLIQMHSWKPEIYVDFPSLNDATPSYYTENKDYFEKGYKYRITVSKDVGI